MSDEWDDDKDLAVVNDNWDDDEVADDWDAIDEEVTEKVPTQSLRSLKAKMKASNTEEAKSAADIYINETEQERKARLELLVKERDLENAMNLFDIAVPKRDSKSTTNTTNVIMTDFLDSTNPITIVDHEQLGKQIAKKLQRLEESKHYNIFLETLVNSLYSTRDVPEIRSISSLMNDLITRKLKEKQSAAQAVKTIAAVKKAPVVSLKVSKGSGKFDDCYAYDDDGFDD